MQGPVPIQSHPGTASDANRLGSATWSLAMAVLAPLGLEGEVLVPGPTPGADAAVIMQGRAAELPGLGHRATGYCKY